MINKEINNVLFRIVEDLEWFSEEHIDEWCSAQIDSCMPWFAIWR